MTQLELSALVKIDKSVISATLDSLEAKGLVVRAPDPRDRRARRPTLTARGRKLCQRATVVTEKSRAGSSWPSRSHPTAGLPRRASALHLRRVRRRPEVHPGPAEVGSSRRHDGPQATGRVVDIVRRNLRSYVRARYSCLWFPTDAPAISPRVRVRRHAAPCAWVRWPSGRSRADCWKGSTPPAEAVGGGPQRRVRRQQAADHGSAAGAVRGRAGHHHSAGRCRVATYSAQEVRDFFALFAGTEGAVAALPRPDAPTRICGPERNFRPHRGARRRGRPHRGGPTPTAFAIVSSTRRSTRWPNPRSSRT